MHKLVILIETQEDESAFNDEWPLFLFLAERMPGLRRETTSHIDKVMYGNASYSLIHELFFDTLDDLKGALASQEGRLAGTQIQRMTRGQVVLLIADHKEDTLDHIQHYQSAPVHLSMLKDEQTPQNVPESEDHADLEASQPG